MAMSPTEFDKLQEKLHKENEEKADQLETHIDSELKKVLESGNIIPNNEIPILLTETLVKNYYSNEVLSILKKRYKKAGWVSLESRPTPRKPKQRTLVLTRPAHYKARK